MGFVGQDDMADRSAMSFYCIVKPFTLDGEGAAPGDTGFEERGMSGQVEGHKGARTYATEFLPA